MWQKRIKNDDRPFTCKRNSKQQKQGILSCIKLFNAHKQQTKNKSKSKQNDIPRHKPILVPIKLEGETIPVVGKNMSKDSVLSVDTDEGCFSCDPSEGSCEYASLVRNSF